MGNSAILTNYNYCFFSTQFYKTMWEVEGGGEKEFDEILIKLVWKVLFKQINGKYLLDNICNF